MASDEVRNEAAQALLEAESTGKPVPPLTETYEGLTLDDAYAIQLAQVRTRLDRGERVRGHKVGLTSLAMQRMLGVDQPDFGHLWESMFHLEHAAIPASTWIAPRVEPEIAFVLKRPLAGPGVTLAEVVAAVDYVVPALEIIDSRIEDWRIGLLDTVADNASSGGVVLGSKPTRLEDVDLRLVGCVLRNRGVVQASGTGAAVLGSSISSLVWLANTVGRWGTVLEAGHVILPGSVTAAIPVAPGDTVTAQFGGPLGGVTARFTA
ncbi:2-keto-4-pentenoate hydratase [Nocardioides sp. GY 10127]|uniref:2-keto-4-pentenoate hydratase n=1 Tax=Nocardioides sp. GY 10127 TaxID=2569762 RepID=UPI0010A8BB7F|nr:2-keto-4-pentenoate hydratase [Nocardioides sp. GY 10127]TIC81774.1 2-keto-4-pentenoate hydratase [Nocardioides sp. GY 10127]